VIRVNTELLLFPIRVRDKRKPEQKLTESDLTLQDKDRVTNGLYFSAGADRLALVFALDESGSLREIIAQQREAALALFARFGEKSRVAVLRFSTNPTLVAEFGRDLEAAQAAFSFPASAPMPIARRRERSQWMLASPAPNITTSTTIANGRPMPKTLTSQPYHGIGGRWVGIG